MATLSPFKAVQENLFGHVSFVQSRVSGMVFRSIDRLEGVPSGVAFVDSGLDSDTFNKILWGCDSQCGCREVEPADALLSVQTALVVFEDRAVTLWAGVENGQKPEEPNRLRVTLGLQVVETETAMSLALSDGAGSGGSFPEGLRIIPVRTDAELEAFVSVMAANWTPPDVDVADFYRRAASVLLNDKSPMRLFVGFAGGEAMTCGELFLSEGGGVAGLHMICTREAYRRRGAGHSMSAALLDEGRKAGASLAVLLASADGERVYRRLGFVPCGVFTEYAMQPEILI